MTPREIERAMSVLGGGRVAAPGRGELAEMMERFPDSWDRGEVDMAEDVTVRINADTQPFQDALQNLEKLSASFGSQLAGALKSAAVGGKELDDVLRRIGLNLAGLALEQGLKPLRRWRGPFSNLLGGLTGLLPFARGGVPGHVVPFAAGGVVSTPSFFQMGKMSA